MLARGKDIYDKKLPVFGDLKDIACLQVYERWLFASLATNEATPDPDPEEVYVREKFYPKKSSNSPTNKAQGARTGILPMANRISIADLKNVDPDSIIESDLGKIISDFINLKESEIDSVIDCLQRYDTEEARDECIKNFKPFLSRRKNGTPSFLQSDDGISFFLAVMFSFNCDRPRRRKLLSELKGKGRE